MYKEHMQKSGYKVIESDVFDISGRLKAYDPFLFLVFNPGNKTYEVWTSERGLQFVTRADQLDARILEKVKRADGRTEYGIKAKIDDLKAQREYEERKEREDARETAELVKSELQGMDVGRKTIAM